MELREEDDTCDEQIFSFLHKRLANELFRYLYYKFGKEAEAEDSVQEAFVKLWNNCKNVPPDKARSFLYTVSSNLSLNKIKHEKVTLDYASRATMKVNVENPEYVLREKEFSEKLKKVLEDLPEGQRTAFMMNRIDKMKHKDIAEALGISQKAVEKRIYTALSTIKEKIQEFR